VLSEKHKCSASDKKTKKKAALVTVKEHKSHKKTQRKTALVTVKERKSHKKQGMQQSKAMPRASLWSRAALALKHEQVTKKNGSALA